MIREESFFCDELELSISLSAGYSRSGTGSEDFGISNRSTISTAWTTNQVDTLLGVSLIVDSRVLGSVYPSLTETVVSVEVPLLGIDNEFHFPYSASPSANLRFQNFGMYGKHNSKLVTIFEDIELRYNDGLVATWDDGCNFEGEMETPSGFPIFGIPPQFVALASINPMPVIGWMENACEASVNVIANALALGGYRFRVGETWYEVPVRIPNLLGYPSGSNCIPLDDMEVSGNRSNSMTVQSKSWILCEALPDVDIICNPCASNEAVIEPRIIRIHPSVHRDGIVGSEARLFADLTKAIQILNWKEDHSAHVHRSPMPETNLEATSTCCKLSNPNPGDFECPDGSSAVAREQVHPPYSVYEDVVTSQEDPFFEPFGETTFAFASKGGYAQESGSITYDTLDPGKCELISPGSPDDTPDKCATIIAGYKYYKYTSKNTSFGSVLNTDGTPEGPLDHQDISALYNNTIANPHWSCWDVFPPNTIDTDGDLVLDAQVRWPVFGQRISNLYWIYPGEQWHGDSFLSVSKRTYGRNTIISDPLFSSSGAFALEAAYTGYPTSWYGIPGRFKTVNLDDIIQEQAPLDDRVDLGVIVTDNCSVAYVSGQVQVTVTSGTECSIRYPMGSFLGYPYQFPHIMHSVKGIRTAPWSVPFNSVEIAVISAYGERSVIGTTQNVKHLLPQTAFEDRYIGSYAQNHDSLGLLLELGETDFGYDMTDSGSNVYGESLSAMGDPALASTHSLLQSHSGAYLEFKFDFKVAETVAVMDYPILYFAPDEGDYRATLVPIDRLVTAVIWPKGQCYQSSRWRWWDYDAPGFLSTPELYGFGQMSSVVDMLQTNQVVWMALDPLTTLEAAYRVLEVFSHRELFESGWDPGDHTPTEIVDSAALRSRAIHVQLRDSTSRAGVILQSNLTFSTPPFNWLPNFKLDVNLTPTEEFSQTSYSLAVGPRRVVNSMVPLHTYAPGSPRIDQWSRNSPLYSAAGWIITEHDHRLANDEGYYDLVAKGKLFGKATPWHSYVVSVGGGATVVQGNLHMAPSPHGVLFLLIKENS